MTADEPQAIGPFIEVGIAHEMFRIFELHSTPIGSGRPSGLGHDRWGAVVVVSRSALESAFHRIHAVCNISGCTYSKFPTTQRGFRDFAATHCGGRLPDVPELLHASLFRKAQPNAGAGSGVPIDGPRTADDLLTALDGLHHIRNGFAHKDPKKTDRLPPSGDGVLWVQGHETAWSVQKPHAMSVMRLCEMAYRYLLLIWHGLPTALQARGPLPRFLVDEMRLSPPARNPSQIAELVLGSLRRRAFDEAVSAARDLPEAIFGAKYGRVPRQEPLFDVDLPTLLFEPWRSV